MGNFTPEYGVVALPCSHSQRHLDDELALICNPCREVIGTATFVLLKSNFYLLANNLTSSSLTS